jgi:ATP-dependent exoDNAse (exonuclease V) beta subunit
MGQPRRDEETDARVVVRGVIDCLAMHPSGRAVVLEFKSGAPRTSDNDQMQVYVTAAKYLCPSFTVEGALVYAPGLSRDGSGVDGVGGSVRQ